MRSTNASRLSFTSDSVTVNAHTLGVGDPPNTLGVPEPGTWLLMAGGLGGAAVQRRRRAG